MNDLQAHNRSEWRANTRDQMKDFACEGARERLERMLVPLRGNHAELLVEKASGNLYAFSQALDSTLDDYEAALRAMVANTRTLAEMLALRCEWCGEQSCQDREQHRQLNAQREQTWRESSAAGAVGAATPSALGSGQVAAADGAAGLPPHGPAAHQASECEHGCKDGLIPIGECNCAPSTVPPYQHYPRCGYEPCPDHYEVTGLAMEAPAPNASEGGAGTDTGRSVPALGDCEHGCWGGVIWPPGVAADNGRGGLPTPCPDHYAITVESDPDGAL